MIDVNIDKRLERAESHTENKQKQSNMHRDPEWKQTAYSFLRLLRKKKNARELGLDFDEEEQLQELQAKLEEIKAKYGIEEVIENEE